MVRQTPAPLTHSLPAVPASVPQLRRVASRFAANAGMVGPTLENLELAVTEAVSNAVVHAYIDREEPGPVRLKAAVRGDAVHVTVADEGRGMMPRVDSPGLGLGLPIIAQSAESFDVHRGRRGGTELHMRFRLA
jgi:anti-sigma regulatory factor (Ser/Thr protein kinase)